MGGGGGGGRVGGTGRERGGAGNEGDSGDKAGFESSWLRDPPTRSSGRWKLVAVGVWLRFDNIDRAEPGRGLGLGLGGISESTSERLTSGMSSSCEAIDAEPDPERDRSDVPNVSSAVD